MTQVCCFAHYYDVTVEAKASELTEQAAEDAQACRVSGAVQEDHQVMPGGQVLPLEPKDLLHLAFGRCFIFFRSCILL